jgi:NAD(P)-dependent dehydrogenase (short-subunit alcohol dehydrogenase family)
MTSFDLTGRVALVTGGTKGIGHGVVRQLLTAGADVALTSRTAADCERVATELGAEFGGGRVAGFPADLADRSALAPLVTAVTDRFGRVDTLVANAGLTGGHGPTEQASLDHFAAMLMTNVVNNFELARLVAAPMAERGDGSIVFISSIAAVTPMPTNVAYAAAKAALNSVSKSLAAAWVGQGVRVNVVSPGLIRSHSSRVVWENADRAADYYRDNIPIPRIGEAEEVGAACVFLAATASAYTTGMVLPVDGGRDALGSVTARPKID